MTSSPFSIKIKINEIKSTEKFKKILLHIDKIKNGISINDSILTKQAKIFGPSLAISDLEFSYSSGWLEKFKSRYNIRNYEKQGEADSVDMSLVAEGKKLISEKKYSLEDILNFDETALFYRFSQIKMYRYV